MKIKNFSQLAKSPEREALLRIADAGLRAIDTHEVVSRSLHVEGEDIVFAGEKISLGDGRLFLVSIGKCGLEAAQEIARILGEKIYKGVVIDVHEGKIDHPDISAFSGDHPFPSERNISATKEMIHMLSESKEGDVVIAVISGGGSSLLCQPENLTCHQEKEIVECLFKGGAPIEEVNTVRKHLSLAKGGYLAQYAHPARVFGLIFSDVPGNKLEFIASGPTVLDTTTIEDAKEVLEKYGISGECSFAESGLIETPKDVRYFSNVKNTLLVSNDLMLEAMRSKAEELGFHAEIRTNVYSGQARHVGAGIVDDLEVVSPGTILLYGGESTVILKGGGTGGRNLEVSLSALRFLTEKDLVLSLASDGRDNCEFAGGLCDIMTRQKAEELGLDPKEFLNRNDSFHFFEKIGDYVETGNTGSNVADVILAMRKK